MKNNINVIDDKVYGAGGKLVSFGFGTIAQAYADRTVGGINYGHDTDLVTGHDFGCQYMEGMLISSRVLDITVGAKNANGETPVRVVYVDAGEVKSENFVTVDKELVDALIEAAMQNVDTSVDEKVAVAVQTADEHLNAAVADLEQQIADVSVFVPEYEGSEYIKIAPDGSNYIVSVKYDELFTKVKDDLNIEGIDSTLEELGAQYVALERVVRENDEKTTAALVDVSTEIDALWEAVNQKEKGWIDVSTLLGEN
jgi:hypothetical protein